MKAIKTMKSVKLMKEAREEAREEARKEARKEGRKEARKFSIKAMNLALSNVD